MALSQAYDNNCPPHPPPYPHPLWVYSFSCLRIRFGITPCPSTLATFPRTLPFLLAPLLPLLCFTAHPSPTPPPPPLTAFHYKTVGAVGEDYSIILSFFLYYHTGLTPHLHCTSKPPTLIPNDEHAQWAVAVAFGAYLPAHTPASPFPTYVSRTTARWARYRRDLLLTAHTRGRAPRSRIHILR